MWCSNCQQDVPAIASSDESKVCCARCQAPLGTHTQPDGKTPQPASEPGDPTAPPLLEDWQFEEDLQAARHRIEMLGLAPADVESPAAVQRPAGRQPAASPRRRRRSTRTSLASWCALSLGIMALMFGGVLLGWSFLTDRHDLWRLGMPFTLIGQAAMVVGLVLQLDGLWRSNREANQTLDELDEQLDELRRATSLLSTTHSSHSQSFYVHMAERASPQLLLADLKGQLDLLAIQLAEQRDRGKADY